MSGQWAATLGSFCDGGRSASGPAWRWPICRHCLGVSRRHIDHRLAGGLDGGRCATAGPRPYGQIDHRRREDSNGGRCAVATRRRKVGRSTTVRQGPG